MDFYQKIIATSGDVILLSGDIAEAPSIQPILKEMVDSIQRPIYFVLGNHDYYHGSVYSVRQEMTTLTKGEPLLFWLPGSGPQKLSKDVILLGQDCFADGRYGDYFNSRIVLNDSRMIIDLVQSSILGKYQLLQKMQQLADQDAYELKVSIEQAIHIYHPNKIIVLIHVPPFIEVCMHESKPSNNDFLPFFSSKVTGDVLIQVAKDYKDVEFLVLCGHTHNSGFFQPCENLIVKAGSAEYRRPIIQEVIEA
jgi:predicted MPP superfamily phosphohydrolase